MGNALLCGTVFCGTAETDGAKLKENPLFLTVIALGGGSQAVNIGCADSTQNLFRIGSTGMMTFVHQNQSIVFY